MPGQLTCRLGIQVGLPPRFSLSIRVERSSAADSSRDIGGDDCLGLSGIGPSHSSGGRLSSDRRLCPSGLVSAGGCGGGGGSGRLTRRSSRSL